MTLTAGDGDKSLTVTAADAAANTGVRTTSVGLDTTAPTLDVEVADAGHVPGATLYTGSVTLGVSGAATDAGSAALTVKQKTGSADPITIIDGAGGSFNATLTLAENADTEVVITATDPAGNETIETIQVWRDTAAPSIAATLGATVTSADSVTFSGTVQDGDLDRLETLASLALTVHRDGELVETRDLGVGATFGGSVDLPADGGYSLTFAAADRAGNVAAASWAVIRDTDVLAVSVAVSDDRISAADAAAGDGITVTVTTAVGAEVVMKLNGTEVASGTAVDVGGSGVLTATVTLSTDGEHTIIAAATGANARTGTGQVSVIRDTVAPTLTGPEDLPPLPPPPSPYLRTRR